MVWRTTRRRVIGVEDKTNSVTLPAGLRGQFAAFERRLWRVESAQAAATAALALGVSYLAQFASDRVWDSPTWWRLSVALAGWAVAAWAALGWSRRWVFGRRDLRALARLVQQRYRRLGDRLLGVVELTEEQRHLPDFSPELYRAAIQQVAQESANYDFAAAVSSRTARRTLAACAGLLGLVLLPVGFTPAAALNALQRWLKPLATVERFTLVEIAGLPAEKIVPHGESFDVECAVVYRSFWKPARVVARYARQAGIEEVVADGRVRLRVPGQVERGLLRVRVGDAVREVAIVPTHRPSLRELAAQITLPDYLQYPPQVVPVQNSALSVLAGSRVVFTGKANRPLAEAQFQVDDHPAVGMTVRGQEFESPEAGLDGAALCAFSWRDTFGLESRGPWKLGVQPLRDAPPLPELPDLGREVAILETEVLLVNATATDDFGVKDLGLHWEVVSAGQPTNAAPRHQFQVQAGSPREKRLEHSFRFSPAVLGIPADTTVELRAVATDFRPGREPSLSPVCRVFVLGTEQHAELVRQRLESLLFQLEEVTRLEEKIVDDTTDLNALAPEKLAAAESTSKLDEAQADQRRNAATLEQLAQDGANTLREALRNPTIPEQTIRQWSQTVQAMQDLAQGPMQQAAQALNQAQQAQAARGEHVAQALQHEQQALDALANLQRQVNQNLDQLQALTLAQRLRKLSADEQDIQAQLRKLVPETIGLLPRELPTRLRRANEALATTQAAAQTEAQTLQGEISRFFERTAKPAYGQVSQQMKEARTGEELERLGGLIGDNVAMQAMQHLTLWSERFAAWADLLQPPRDASAGGGEGGGEGGQSQDLTPQLIALLRLREKEFDLREQTQVVEQRKAEEDLYRGLAWYVGFQQQLLADQLAGVRQQLPLAVLQQPLEETHDAMREAETILKRPQTDAEADRAEVRAIELLSDVINLIVEQAQPSSGGRPSPSQQEMAFLMQMLGQRAGQQVGMNVGQQAGGSLAGGRTDRPSQPGTGDATGKAGEARSVSRAGGRAQNLPSEFRDALEGYFNAIE